MNKKPYVCPLEDFWTKPSIYNFEDLKEENKQLRLALSYCGTNQTNPDTCGCCGLHFADCEADLMCYGIECSSCEGEFSKQCHVCNGKELYSEEFWSCPGAHARAALK